MWHAPPNGVCLFLKMMRSVDSFVHVEYRRGSYASKAERCPTDFQGGGLDGRMAGVAADRAKISIGVEFENALK